MRLPHLFTRGREQSAKECTRAQCAPKSGLQVSRMVLSVNALSSFSSCLALGMGLGGYFCGLFSSILLQNLLWTCKAFQSLLKKIERFP